MYNYGFKELITLLNLEEAQLLRNENRASDFNFALLKDKFGLIEENFDPINPTNFHYVHNGYAPFSVKLIEKIFENKGTSKSKEI